MSCSIDFRRHVLSVRVREGLSFAQTANRFSVGIASIKRWSKRLEPKPYDRKAIRKLDPEELAQDVREHPDACQHERARKFGVSPKAIWQALRKLGVTYKKIADAAQGGRQRAAFLPEEDCGA